MPEPLFFHRRFRLVDLPREGRAVIIIADDEERAALARALDLVALDSFRVEVELKPRGERLHAHGTIDAQVIYQCVVTLEPFPGHVTAPLDVVFGKISEIDSLELSELELSPHDDPPEPFIDDCADLGKIVAECLSLALDPYPRKAEVSFFEPAPETEPPPSPFAALAKLKPGAKL